MMNEQIQKLVEQCTTQYPDGNGGYIDQVDTEKLTELFIQECENYILSEVERLVKYQNSLSEDELNRKDDVEICIEKCYDNILGIRQHFGVDNA
jgi:hypothetical protein